MLYKKFHRNYVKQFKEGARFAIGSGKSGKVISEPFCLFKSIYIGDSEHLWILVLPNGQTNKNLYVI